MSKMFKRILDRIAARLGYVGAEVSAPTHVALPAPQAEPDHLTVLGTAKQPMNIPSADNPHYAFGAFQKLPNGKVIFPIPFDSSGKPIQFQRGVAYIVGTNGRWRKRKHPRGGFNMTPPEASPITEDELEDVEAGDEAPALEAAKQSTGKTENDDIGDLGSQYGDGGTWSPEYRKEVAMHRHWRVLMASCFNSESKFFKRFGPHGASVVEEWRDFATFERDIKAFGGVVHGKSLVRKNAMMPFGPGNVKWARGSSAETGFVSPNRKLTDIQIKHIRNSPQNPVALAMQYGVNAGTISQIRSGKTYRNVK